MAEFPALPLWTDAYLADTKHLSTIEHGAYLLLLMCMWRSKGKLPNNDKLLARYAGLTAGQWKRIKPILWPLFDVTELEISQGRLTDELSFVRQRSNKASDSAKSRWLKNKETGNANASSEHSEGNAPTPTPITTPPSYPTDTTSQQDDSAKKPKPKTKRGTRIAPDWVPNENDRQFALNEGLSHDTIDRIAAEFRDYWISVAGAKGTKLDWSATWRNRVRSIQDRGGQGARAPGPRSPHQTLFDGAAASAAKHERGEGYG